MKEILSDRTETGFVMPKGPRLGDDFPDVIERLVHLREGGVTHFYGGPLHLDNSNAWLSPIDVEMGDDRAYFQAIYVNGRPEDMLNDESVPVTLLHLNEADFKLVDPKSKDVAAVRDILTGNDPYIVIRPCHEGMAFYPHAISPDDIDPLKGLDNVIKALGIHEPTSELRVGNNFPYTDVATSLNGLAMMYGKKIPFRDGEVFSYGINLPNDPWKVYQILSPRRIDRCDFDSPLVRVDSGCDIGQIFDDKGCDCREQLHTALNDICADPDGGLIVHIAAQDGRGLGAATKMETEALKRGIVGATNAGNPEPVDTIEAALRVVGPKFDVRTYGGAGLVLGGLGIDSVTLQTDNKKKISGLVGAGINVVRKPTGTTGGNGSSDHVMAKHRFGDIYFSDDKGHGAK